MVKDFAKEIEAREKAAAARDEQERRAWTDKQKHEKEAQEQAKRNTAEIKQNEVEERLVASRAKKKAARVAEIKADGELVKAKSDKGLKIVRSATRWVIPAILAAVAVFGARGCNKALDKNAHTDPETGKKINPIEHVAERATTAIIKGADAGAQVAETLADGAKAGAETVDGFVKRPAFLKFIRDTEQSWLSGRRSWLPGAMSFKANGWTSKNPDQPLSEEQLKSILEARKNYKSTHNGQIMPVEEFYKLVGETCPSWPKDKKGPIITSRITKEGR